MKKNYSPATFPPKAQTLKKTAKGNVMLFLLLVLGIVHTQGQCTDFVQIPDSNFKNALLNNSAINTNNDTEISCSEAVNFTGTMDVQNLSIADLTGIEAFSNINILLCGQNALTNLDLFNNTALQALVCSNNDITFLDVSNNTLLDYLSCYENALTDLNVSNNPALKYLTCSENAFSSLDVSNNPLLEQLRCQFNNLTSLDLSNNSVLEELFCYNNGITNLNLSNNPVLENLICSNNALTGLDMSNNTGLGYLNCSGNPLFNLDVSNNMALTELYCVGNNLTSLDVANNTSLELLQCYNNQLTSLNVANGNNMAFTDFDATNNPSLTCIQVDDVAYSAANWTDIDDASSFSADCSVVAVVYIPDTNFKNALVGNTAINTDNDTEISYTEATALTGTLNVSSLNIADLTGIEAFTNITGLVCSENDLTSLDLANNTALTDLDCSDNDLTSLDVSNNTALTDLDCSDNDLTSLDVSNNTALTGLTCNENNLSSLDVANGNNMAFTDFDATNNPSLTCIQVDDVAYSAANWTDIDDASSFSADCSLVAVVYIPDTNFKNALVGNTAINTDNDNEISYAEAAAPTGTLNVSSLNIADLTGIEAFTNITGLVCSENDLVSLDVANNNALLALVCSNNDITALDVSNNTVLDYLSCSENALSSLDVSNNPTLKYLVCSENALSSLDVSSSPLLEQLRCHFNNLTSLDVANNLVLEELFCYNNGLSDLDLSNNPVLENLICSNNVLAGLDISNNTDLGYLNCSGNPLFNLDISNNMALTELYCVGNNLTSLDVANNTALKDLRCYFNELTSLDVANNAALTNLRCYNNQLTSLNVANGNNMAFTDFDATNNPSLTCIQVDDPTYSANNWTDIDPTAIFNTDCAIVHIPDANFKTALLNNTAINTNNDTEISYTEAAALTGTLNVSSLNIADLTGIEAFTNITGLVCSQNGLTSLDVSNNMALIDLDCFNNDLTSLDVSENTALLYLQFANNGLTSLDVANNTALKALNCSNNDLTSLDVSNNPDLTYLNCTYNSLTSLDVASNNNTEITYFFSSSNPNLTCIQVDDVAYSTTNWTDIDPSSSFSADCGYTSTSSISSKTVTDDSKDVANTGNTANEISFVSQTFVETMSVYPNPVVNTLNISMPSGFQLKNAKVYNLLEKEVLSFTENQVDTGSLPSGMYILKIEGMDGSIVTKKIIKR
ncbi:MAG: T9SS type A sorting domain-containing protein [Flavobacteriaceae bacterium]